MFSLRFTRAGLCPSVRPTRLLFVVGLVTVILPVLLKAVPPQWWYDQGVIDPTQQPNDYAAVNQGQVKFIAEQAAAELDAYCPGGAGDIIHQLVATWGAPTATTNDFTAVNLGQLKALAQPFYDRLIYAKYTTTYPWNGSLTQANDFAAANIGQVKNLFSFDLTSTDATHDANGDGLPDWWEKYYGLTGVSASSTVPWNSNLTYLQALQQGLNPVDFYNGQSPTLAIAGGNGQTGPPNGFVPSPLLVSTVDSNGNALVGAPVTFTVTSSGGQLQKSSSSTPGTSLTVLTDYNGQAQAFFKLPNVQDNTSTITATPGSGTYAASLPFTESSDGGGGSYGSPFAPSNVTATLNSDGSATITWTNNRDPSDLTPIDVQYMDAKGNIVTVATVKAGMTSYTIPAH